MDRRDLIKRFPILTLAALAGAGISLPKVEKKEEWEEIPNFYDGKILLAEDLNKVTNCILQLQNEIERLRNK